MEQRELSKWLRIVLIGMGICGVIIYLLIVPGCGRWLVEEYPEFANRYWPWLIFLWMTGIPVFAVLVFGWKITGNICNDKSFSEETARYLVWISRLSAGDTAFFFLVNVLFLMIDMTHPSVVLASLFVVFAGVAVAVASAVLSHLVRKAAVLQEQSDLTI